MIGDDAGQKTMSAGYGSSRVKAGYVVAPLAALRLALGPKVKVTYSPGGGASLLQPAVPANLLVAPSPLKAGPEPPEFSGTDPQGVADLQVLKAPSVSAKVATAAAPGQGQVLDDLGRDAHPTPKRPVHAIADTKRRHVDVPRRQTGDGQLRASCPRAVVHRA